MEAVLEEIKKQVESNSIIVYMKGSPEAPQCGFSMRAAQILSACGVQFAYVNVLDNQEIREGIKQYGNWPTIPQLYINGELVGGCDIMMELFQSGELKKMVEAASAE